MQDGEVDHALDIKTEVPIREVLTQNLGATRLLQAGRTPDRGRYCAGATPPIRPGRTATARSTAANAGQPRQSGRRAGPSFRQRLGDRVRGSPVGRGDHPADVLDEVEILVLADLLDTDEHGC